MVHFEARLPDFSQAANQNTASRQIVESLASVRPIRSQTWPDRSQILGQPLNRLYKSQISRSVCVGSEQEEKPSIDLNHFYQPDKSVFVRVFTSPSPGLPLCRLVYQPCHAIGGSDREASLGFSEIGSGSTNFAGLGGLGTTRPGFTFTGFLCGQ